MKNNKVLILLLGAITIFSCKNEPQLNEELDIQLEEALKQNAPDGNLEFYTMPDSDDFEAIPQDPKNPLSENKVKLGKMLFHESGLGLKPENGFNSETFSCATCHFAGAGFQAGRFQGLGEGGVGFGINGEGRMRGPLVQRSKIDAQPVRTPTAMNGAYQINMLWNGQFGGTGLNLDYGAQFTPGTPKETNELGFEGLETQAIAGLGVHRLEVDETIVEELGYKEMFDAAFGDFDVSERYTKETAGLAIAAFERTVLSNQAPFQQWLKGDKSALSESEKQGAVLFFDKGQCSSCHTGPALNTMEFHALGMKDLHECPEEVFKTDPEAADHLGRGGFTGLEEDKYKFKVPQLYNLTDSPFYGHGSSFRSVRAVLDYKNTAIKENDRVPTAQLSDKFEPLGLTPSEIDALTTFVEISLRDDNLLRYQPDFVNSGHCIPMNDPMSKNHLGCE